LLDYYSYPQQSAEVETKKIEEKHRYTIRKMSFPSAINVFGTENIRVDYYFQKEQGKFPTVIIFPISGGVDFSVRSFAHCFASHGFNCAIIHNRKADLGDAKLSEDVENYFRQVVLDGRQVLDWLVQRPEVDIEKIGCLGLSLGGIKATLMTAVDERIKCTVIGLAGGSIADITLSTGEKNIRNYINELIEKGIKPQDIHSELSQKIITDPLKLAPYINAANMLMYIAAFDRVVPTQCGKRLLNAMGKPEAVYLFSGHYGSFLYLPYVEGESLRFVKQKLQCRKASPSGLK
jgi:dienelactone hydrolase